MRIAPLGVAFGFAAPALALGYVTMRALRHPATRPERYDPSLRRAGDRLVVCAGDSITHGAVSFDYVAALAEGRFSSGWRFVNAGINGDRAVNLETRVEEILACEPDFITVLIGTNDVIGMNSQAMALAQRVVKGAHEPPTLAAYERHLRSIVKRLRAGTRARIALITLPLLGDDLEAPIHQTVRSANELIRRVAEEESITLLDLTAALEAEHARLAPGRRIGFGLGAREAWWAARAPLLRYIGGLPFDQIAAGIGLAFTSDLIHLNERSGSVLAELVESFLRDASHGAPGAETGAGTGAGAGAGAGPGAGTGAGTARRSLS